jgi:cobalt-zinc-cadmium efflux system membrane fusion protein
MHSKTILLLACVALGGIVLGAAGMQYFGSWEGIVQTLATLRQPENSSQPTRRTAAEPPIDQAGHDAHEEHTHAGETHAHDAEPPRQINGKGVPTAKTDTHEHGEDAHDHDAEQVVRLSADKAQQLGIEVAVARPGSLQTSLTLPGTVALNADRQVHIVSRVPGIVREIRKNLGDAVRAGEIMAVIDSRELADAKATYLAARERLNLAETTLAREKDLWEKQISPEQDYLTAKQATAEARIELRVATQKLHALGFSEVSVQQLAGRPNASLTRYEVVAPLAGTVIEKHIAVGELLKDDAEAFVVADLSTVWVDLNVPPKDLPLVRKGQRVTISADSTMQAEGTVSYVGPIVSEDSRTAVTRVVLPNPDGHWRPGLFVTAALAVGDTAVAVLIPKTALQTIDGKPSVFVHTPEGFMSRPVTLGRANETQVEITAGLQAGERYASTETFVLKAELGKGTASHDH